MLDLIIFYSVAVFFYFTPLILFLTDKLVKDKKILNELADRKHIFPMGFAFAVFTAIFVWVNPVIPFIYLIFFILYVTKLQRNLNTRFYPFIISVIAIFTIGELWELPIIFFTRYEQYLNYEIYEIIQFLMYTPLRLVGFIMLLYYAKKFNVYKKFLGKILYFVPAIFLTFMFYFAVDMKIDLIHGILLRILFLSLFYFVLKSFFKRVSK